MSFKNFADSKKSEKSGAAGDGAKATFASDKAPPAPQKAAVGVEKAAPPKSK